MKLIAAADKNWAIGKDGELLVRISEDMKNFSAITTGNVIVMGRKTLESFPGGKPLPNRVNIVLTHEKDYNGKGAIVVHSEEELWEELSKYDTDSIFVTGGESIYQVCCFHTVIQHILLVLIMLMKQIHGCQILIRKNIGVW